MSDRVKLALLDLLSYNYVTPSQTSALNEQALPQEIDANTQGVSLSDAIIEERQFGR